MASRMRVQVSPKLNELFRDKFVNRISNNSDFDIFDIIEIQNRIWIDVSTCKLHLYEEIYRTSWQFPFFGWCWSECVMTYVTLAMAAIVCWQSEADCTELKLDQMYETRLTKLSYAAQQVGIAHFYAVTEIKGFSCCLWWMHEWRNLLTSTRVGCQVCHVGSPKWRVTKIWGPRC